MEMLSEIVLPKQVILAKPIECKGQDHLQSYLKTITESGGEGVMLRQPGSLYHSGRTSTLRRVKEFTDTEVKFIQKSPDGLGLLCQQYIFVLKENLI